MILTLLAILIAALVALAIAAAAIPRSVTILVTAGVSGLIVLLAAASQLIGGRTETLALPVGPPGAAMHLALDPLGAAFLLLVFVAAIPCTIFAGADQDEAVAGIPASLAAVGFTLTAEDPFTLALGLGALGIAGRLLLWSPRADEKAGHFAESYLALAILVVVCLVPALALMRPPSVAWLDCDFAAIRAAPPEGLRADVALLLTLMGAAGLLGHVPFCVRVSRFTGAPALLAGVGANIGFYLLFRVLLDLSGPAQPLWWGVPLLFVGAASAVLGPLRGMFETGFDSSLVVGALSQVGFSLMGVGVALLARGADLPELALLALDASWLLLVSFVLCQTLVLLCAAATIHGTGTRRLHLLGGLIHRMPVTAMCMIAGLFGAAVLPPGLTFAGFWLLFQSLLGAFRIGGFALQLVITFAVLLAGTSVGLGAIAAVRVVGVVFLGRPRTPRTAVAEEVSQQLRWCLIGLAALTGLLAVLPGLAILPASRGLAYLANGSTPGMQLVMKPAAGAPGYAPIPIACLLALAGCTLFWLLRRRGPGHRREPAWSGGFAPPPPWLPFGDPTTQIGAASFVEPLRRLLAPALALHAAVDLFCGPFSRWQDRLRNAAEAVSRPGVPGSVAAMLVVLVVAIAVWLVAP